MNGAFQLVPGRSLRGMCDGAAEVQELLVAENCGQPVASFKYAMRSARSWGFFNPAKTIFVPVPAAIDRKK